MQNYTHHIPVKLCFGEGQIKVLGTEIKKIGTNVLLTYGGGSIKKTGLYDTVMGILKDAGCTVTELSGIDPNPRITSVEEGVKLCRENNIDVILAVGGGSTIDCSKAIAAGVYYDGDLWEMCSSFHGLLKSLPLVDVLTLSATGTEFDPFAVITNMDTNQKCGGMYAYPVVSICDPTYTCTVSAYQTAAGSADIMSHCFEDYIGREIGTEISEGLSETMLKTVMKYCPIAIKEPNNYEARANLMAASNIACAGIASYGKGGSGWPCHAMEHELSAFYDITHGVGLAVLTPRWMRYILAKDVSILPRLARFGRNVMGVTGDDDMKVAVEAIDKLEAYFKSTGIPMTLTELGIGEENFAKMAAQANTGKAMERCDISLTEADVVEIYRACL